MDTYANFRVIDRYLLNLSITPFPLSPSYWFSMLFDLSGDHDWIGYLYYSSLFLTSALLISTISSMVAERLYYSTIQIMEGARQNKQAPDIKRASRLMSTFNWLSPQIRALIVKEIIQFVRTPQQWLQFLIFGFFIGVYLINLSRAEVQMDTLNLFWQKIFYIMNFGFCGFILAALTARFVFPLMSLEGRGLWLLLTAPLTRARLFQEKFCLTAIIFFIMAEIVSIVSNHYLSQNIYISIISTVFLLLISVTLTSLSLGLGAVYLQLEEDNPMKISSGAGGIITVALGLIYLTGMVGFMIWILSRLENAVSEFPFWILILLIIFYNGIFTYLPLRWGYRSLDQREF